MKGETMSGVKNGEELVARLQEASGEEIIACGWGMMGMRNVFVGVTRTAVILEYISLTFKTKELVRIPFEELELVYPVAGDASTPKLMKMNLQAVVNDAMTGTLLLKTPSERLMNITFNKMPRFGSNNKTPFEIVDEVKKHRPEAVNPPEVTGARDKFDMGGCMRRFAVIAGALVVPCMVLMSWVNDWKWEPMVFVTAFFIAVFFAGIFAPLGHWFKRMLTGKG
jgi:hypothetical protein